jgi:2-polyprenyl-6-methoxyphenol hydroxylase-like FAD-dependent oxidoreductase
LSAPERVLIIGGSIGGLAAALALDPRHYEVVVVERDAPPPEVSPDEAFERWERSGVPQFRHAHILLARLHTVIRDHHPALLAELLAAGITLSEVDQMLPPTHVERSQPEPDDDDLRHLWGRRATFEYVVRRHVGKLPHVRFMHQTRVEGLVVERRGEALHVEGLELLSQSGARETLRGDVIVDASGTRSRGAEWLAAHGAKIETERHDSPYAYFCRHYRLRDPKHEPPRRGTGANLDYLWYGLFCAEHGHFSIAMACPDQEKALVETLRRSDGFDFMCGRMPLLATWLRDAEPTGKVHGAGNLANCWTRYGARGGPAVLGYFPVGDSHLRTNPMYGRGCSYAFVQAQILAEALSHAAAPEERIERYYQRTRTLLRTHFDSAVAADRLFLNRGRLQRGESLAPADRLLNYLYDEAFTPALHRSLFVAREMVKAMEMRELSPTWRRLAVVAQVVWAFVAGRFGSTLPALPPLGPSRAELLASLPAGPSPGPSPADEVGSAQ